MNELRVYIASSLKNKNAVEILTNILTAKGCVVLSFLNSNQNEPDKIVHEQTLYAMNSDIVIFHAPSAMIGAAYANHRTIYGVVDSIVPEGIMTNMIKQWFNDYFDLVKHIIDNHLNGGSNGKL